MTLTLSLSLEEFSTFLQENIGIEGNKFTLAEAAAKRKEPTCPTRRNPIISWRFTHVYILCGEPLLAHSPG